MISAMTQKYPGKVCLYETCTRFSCPYFLNNMGQQQQLALALLCARCHLEMPENVWEEIHRRHRVPCPLWDLEHHGFRCPEWALRPVTHDQKGHLHMHADTHTHWQERQASMLKCSVCTVIWFSPGVFWISITIGSNNNSLQHLESWFCIVKAEIDYIPGLEWCVLLINWKCKSLTE